MERDNRELEMSRDGGSPEVPATRPGGEDSQLQKLEISGEIDRGHTLPWPPEPTVLTLRDLGDLPRQVLPEATYRHLKNAGREALLAVISLIDSVSSNIGNSRTGEAGSGKVRRHIDVE